ncbi:MAG TPA: PLP-dependent aminotransferase family protein [Dyella sp.]|uniref:MocR-like pyridoxine biosynthesis transcription factor PdxR n=1 Tax=Dyella sp. TaxID=1869338 RepID=UPI002F93DD7F
MSHLFEFPLELPGPGSRQRQAALHAQLRAAILDGRLKPGARLPATRELSLALGVSRNTVVAAYDLLLSEGYVVARHGAGNYVADIASRPAARLVRVPEDERLAPYWRKPGTLPLPPRVFADDFRVGVPDIANFPFDVWRRLSARALRALSKAHSLYKTPQGQPVLREAIARHVSFARAVACEPDDILVTSGAQQAFDLLARVLVTPGETTVAVENPGYPPLRAAFEAAGARIVPVPVDAQGLVVEAIPASANVVYVTPSHQFPLGMPLSPSRRAALLDFAQAHRATVIEDDYDGEFRYGSRPLDALQTLDRCGAVCYVGTFSKCLFPSLRLGYVVMPPWLKAAIVHAKWLSDWHGDLLAQETLASFIAEGHLVRHIRKMRRTYAERRERLLDALQRHAGGFLKAVHADAGLHLTAEAIPGVDVATWIQAAEVAGIRLENLAGYGIGEHPWRGVTFGLGSIESGAIDKAVRRAVDALPVVR